MDKDNNLTNTRQLSTKTCFIGISLGSSVTVESGIAVLDKDLNLIRVDKVYNLDDLQLYIKNLASRDNTIICIDLPKNANMTNGKWRQEAKSTKTFKLNGDRNHKCAWSERFSERGADLCSKLNSLGYSVYRYNCYFTKNALKLTPPYKSRSPVACKYLQMIIQNNLKISGIPSNLIPLSGLDALIGAYIGWTMAANQESEGYKCIGHYKNLEVISAL